MASTLNLTLDGNAVRLSWTTCTYGAFAGYAVVRSNDHEVHFPPESGEKEVLRISSRSTTSGTDSTAPSGTSWYRVFCVYLHENETKVAGKTTTRQITVP